MLFYGFFLNAMTNPFHSYQFNEEMSCLTDTIFDLDRLSSFH